jgi:aminoglycoside-2''-adenylyltransferase
VVHSAEDGRALPSGFEPILQVAALFRGFERPWFVAGGWAVDFLLDRVTREHGDIDVAVLRDDQIAVRGLFAGWKAEKVVPAPGGGTREVWPENEELTLPVHEVWFSREEGAPRELEVLLNELVDGAWRFRRDPRIELPLEMLGVRSARGLPVLAPEVVLLYKAKAPRATDEDDFAAMLPALTRARRRWLAGALQLCHPGHPWIARLG